MAIINCNKVHLKKASDAVRDIQLFLVSMEVNCVFP